MQFFHFFSLNVNFTAHISFQQGYKLGVFINSDDALPSRAHALSRKTRIHRPPYLCTFRRRQDALYFGLKCFKTFLMSPKINKKSYSLFNNVLQGDIIIVVRFAVLLQKHLIAFLCILSTFCIGSLEYDEPK